MGYVPLQSVCTLSIQQSILFIPLFGNKGTQEVAQNQGQIADTTREEGACPSDTSFLLCQVASLFLSGCSAENLSPLESGTEPFPPPI